MRLRVLAFCFASVFFSAPAVCVQAAGKATQKARVTAPASEPLEVKNTKEFFEWFFRQTAQTPKRSQFETEEAYRKKLPSLDQSKVHYFRVADNENEGSFWYSVRSKTLTLSAGNSYYGGYYSFDDSAAGLDEFPDFAGSMREAPDVLTVARESHSGRSYTGQNAFGVRVRVKSSSMVSYGLLIPNASQVPQYGYGKLKVDLSVDPETARRLSKSCELVVGVSLLDFQKGWCYEAGHSPTLNAPYEESNRLYVIHVGLREIIVRDKFTKSVLRRLVIEPKEGG